MEKVRKYELTYLLGCTIGAVVGFVLAKVYQIWALLYQTEGHVLEGVTSWEGTPLWQTVNQNPASTTFLVTIFFFLVGLCFAHLINKKEDPYCSEKWCNLAKNE